MHAVVGLSDRSAAAAERLDRAQWHKPLISIVVTHHNYSEHLKDALLSVLDQTHENWECVVVDDGSREEHRRAAGAIVEAIGSEKIRLIPLPENVGQLPAVFAGLDATRGEFVCILDPDDRYAETFLAEALAAHLNGAIYAPLVCTDQYLMRDNGVITGIYGRFNKRFIENDIVPDRIPRKLEFISPTAEKWRWTSTSAMMFRRPAMMLMRPHRKLAYKAFADTYLAQGANMLGGSLYLNQPLIYRTAHSANVYLAEGLFALSQDKRRPDHSGVGLQCRNDVIEAIRANGAAAHLTTRKEKNLLKRLARTIKTRWRALFPRRRSSR